MQKAADRSNHSRVVDKDEQWTRPINGEFNYVHLTAAGY
jgi:hypothetical protein